MAYVTVDVDVDISEFSDAELKDEFEARGLTLDDTEEFQRAYMYHCQGKTAMAHEILWELCLRKLNKVV